MLKLSRQRETAEDFVICISIREPDRENSRCRLSVERHGGLDLTSRSASGQTVVVASSECFDSGERQDQLDTRQIHVACQEKGTFVIIGNEQVQAGRGICSARPLYYWFRDETFVASTSMRLLEQYVDLKLDEERLLDHLLFRYVPGPKTHFQNVRRLLPGYDLLAIASKQTWSVKTEPRKYADWSGQWETATLDECLRNPYANHVPVETTILFSGGVDSSIMAKLCQEASITDRTLGAHIDCDEMRGEALYAQSASEIIGTSHCQLAISEDEYPELLDRFISESLELPHHLQTPLLIRLASAVDSLQALCGQGADALFGLESGRMCSLEMLVESNARRLASLLLRAMGKKGAACHLAERSEDITRSWRTRSVNLQGVYGDIPWLMQYWTKNEIQERLLQRYSWIYPLPPTSSPIRTLHWIDYVSDSIDTCTLYRSAATLEGKDLIFPFLHPGILHYVGNSAENAFYGFLRPKAQLQNWLAGNVSRHLAYRPKLGFGPPAQAWLKPRGLLFDRAMAGLGSIGLQTGQSSEELAHWTLWCALTWHALTAATDKTNAKEPVR